MASFQRFRPTSPRFTLQTAMEFPKCDVEFEGIIESCLLAVEVHVWCILLTRKALLENNSTVVTGVKRIWFFFAPSDRTRNRVACKIRRLQTAPRGRLNAKGVSFVLPFG